MANLVTVEANTLLNASSGQANYVNPTAPVKVALNTPTTTPTATTPGSEVVGGSYVRTAITFSAAGSGQITNSTQINWTSMPACTVHSVDEWDSAGTPVRRWFGTLAADKTVNAGDTFSINASSYTKTLS